MRNLSPGGTSIVLPAATPFFSGSPMRIRSALAASAASFDSRSAARAVPPADSAAIPIAATQLRNSRRSAMPDLQAPVAPRVLYGKARAPRSLSFHNRHLVAIQSEASIGGEVPVAPDRRRSSRPPAHREASRTCSVSAASLFNEMFKIHRREVST